MAEQLNELQAIVSLMQQGFTPEQARSQIDEAKAMRFAQMSPTERNTMLAYRGGQQLGRGISSLFGVEQEDPTVRMATQIRSLSGQFDRTTAEGQMQFARALSSINPSLAMQEASKAREMMKAEADIAASKALAASRSRENDPKFLFIKENAEKYTPESLEKFNKTGLYSDLKLITKADATTKPPADFLAVAVELGYGEKATFGAYTSEQVKQINQTLLDRETGRRKAGAPTTSVSVRVADKAAEAMGTKAGGVVGEAVGQIQGKEDAISAVRSALDLVDKGIYAGGYGPMQEAVAKFTPLGSKGRLTNTEQFRATIGEVVIPRLQEFGGNDSVEELKYLRSVVAGETTLEPAAIKRILQQAERKIQRGIQRIQSQQQAVQEGKPLPTSVAGQRKPVDWNSLK